MLLLVLFKGKQRSQRWEHLLLASLFVMPISMACVIFVKWLSQFVPLKYDQYVCCFSSRFDDPSFLIGQYIAPHLWMKIVLASIYSLLPGATLLVYGFYLWKASMAEAQVVLRSFVLLFLLTPLLYIVFPVCGPLYAFHSFPFNPPLHLQPHPIRLTAPPNAVPSGHAATAMLIFYFCRRWKWGAFLSGAFLILTLLATLGSGEHYMFDLLVAVPYAALIIYVCDDPRIAFAAPALSPACSPSRTS